MSHNVLVINPKFRANIGMILRLCAAFETERFYWTGDRAQPEMGTGGLVRYPREERIRDYEHVYRENLNDKQLWFKLSEGYTPIALENREDFQPLTMFQHPKNAIYVFGPEDGDIPQNVLRVCHHFVRIPALHSLNLATAVAITLYDRKLKGDLD